MNKVIEWLFQSTSDGSTYLQVIILLAFSVFVVWSIAKTFQEIAIILGKEGESDDKAEA